MLLSGGVFSLIFVFDFNEEQLFLDLVMTIMGILTSAVYYSGYRDYDAFKADGEKDIDPS